MALRKANITTEYRDVGLTLAKSLPALAWLSAVIISILMMLSTTADARAAQVARRFDANALDKFISGQVARHHIPGLAVAITRGDQIVFVRGYGEAQHRVPVTGKTPFRIASLSKSFTAMAVLQLVEAGQVELDAPIARYLPELALATPLQAERITVRQLLNHRQSPYRRAHWYG